MRRHPTLFRVFLSISISAFILWFSHVISNGISPDWSLEKEVADTFPLTQAVMNVFKEIDQFNEKFAIWEFIVGAISAISAFIYHK